MAKGMIFGVKRMEIHDGDGIRTTVFFKGCPLHCQWCHNPEGIGFRPQIAWFQTKCIGCASCDGVCAAGAIQRGIIDRNKCVQCGACTYACPVGALTLYGREVTAAELAEEAARDLPFFEATGGGVTLSGGECLVQPELAIETAKLLHERGISVYIDTCGDVDQHILERILPYADCFLYDIKAADPQLHRQLTGRDNQRILENLRYLAKAGARIEIRYPMVVGRNDTEAGAMAALLAEINRGGESAESAESSGAIVKVKILPYHDYARSRYEALGMECVMPDASSIPDTEQLQQAVSIFQSAGLNAVNGAEED